MGDVFKVCYCCGKNLTDEEQKIYWNTAERCCSGRDCGCQGMPLSPPQCFKCSFESLYSAWEREKERAWQATAKLTRIKAALARTDRTTQRRINDAMMILEEE